MIITESQNDKRTVYFRYLVILSFIVLTADFIYKIVNHINFMDRSACILNQALPPLLFLFYEYFVELGMIVITGIFISVALEGWFTRYRKFYPSNPVTAFLYASVMPVCSCSVLPLLQTMHEKLSYRTLITFIVAAPLLNPYIIVLSFTVLGPVYGILRIVTAFIIALSAGFFMQMFDKKFINKDDVNLNACNPKACTITSNNLFEKSFTIFIQILPYLVLAGVLGMVSESVLPNAFMAKFETGNGLKSLLLFVTLGMPVYFCNGTDVLFLRPLLCNGMGMGTAIAFSMTSTAICISSFIMLLKFLGKKQTLWLSGFILFATVIMGLMLNLVAG